MTNSRITTLEAGPVRLDEHARLLASRVATGDLDPNEAACQVLATAVDCGVVRQMSARHHRQLATRWNIDDVTATVTSMLVSYALANENRPGNLDVTRFADGTTSAAGWIGKVIGSMRASRILREMHADATAPVDLLGDEDPTSVPSAEETALDANRVNLEDHTKGLPAASATIRIVHAAALHQLLGLPPLQPWNLTPAQRRELIDQLELDPTLAHRTLVGDPAVPDETRAALQDLWGGWSPDDVAAMLAKSTPIRDIPHLLCSAALKHLPRPKTRGGALAHAHDQMLKAAPEGETALFEATFTAFLESAVAPYTDFDRIRRPLTPAETAQREDHARELPTLIAATATALEVTADDILAGLIALFIDPLPIAATLYFTPTPWRFRP